MAANAEDVQKKTRKKPPAPPSAKPKSSVRVEVEYDDEGDDIEAGRSVNSDEESEPVPQPRSMSRDRFSFFRNNSTVAPAPVEESTSFRGYQGGYQPPSTPLLREEIGPSETECTWAKSLCGLGTFLSASGSTLFAFACYLAAQQMKDIQATHIVCCSEAIGGSACICGTCMLCIGAGMAFHNAKRR